LADDVSERDQAIDDQFRVLDEVGAWLTTSGIRIFPAGEFHVAPDFESNSKIRRQVLNRGVATSLLTVEYMTR
jgi:hypothetical protein